MSLAEDMMRQGYVDIVLSNNETWRLYESEIIYVVKPAPGWIVDKYSKLKNGTEVWVMHR